MRVISLLDQLYFARECLSKMINKSRPDNEIALQESIVGTIENRIREKETKP